MVWHLNPETGNTSQCTASIKACPFGEHNHFENRDEARHAYEMSQKAFRATVTSDLKHLDTEGLHSSVLFEARNLGMRQAELASLDMSMSFAAQLHEGQTRKADVQGRKNTPYIEHPLRNALRLIRLGVKDLDVLNAAVLHDTVEDCGEKYCEMNYPDDKFDEEEARLLLSGNIGETFGPRCQEIVLGVTNPYEDPSTRRALSQEEKHQSYRAQVTEEIARSSEIYLVKLADIIDNAGSLHHALPEELKSARRLAVKYLPLMRTFMDQLEEHRPALLATGLHEDTMGFIREKLQRTETRLDDLLTAA